MSHTPVITGIGLVTPLGSTAAATWAALLAGRYITDHAKVPLEFSDDLPRVSHLAIRAAREAVGPQFQTGGHCDTALVMGTSKGPVENWLNTPSRLSDPKNWNHFGLAGTATDVADALGLIGPRLTISAACASGLHALIRGAMLIESGHARRVVVIAAEASVHPLFLASFKRLGVLPADGVGCRPFDRSRDGFLMGEAAAAVCLEAAAPAQGQVAVERFALAGDATHLTGLDPDARALRHVLDKVVGRRPFDLLHAHGTGTAVNDEIELAALDQAVPQSEPRPAVYSHKAALGHSLGAAGLVSIVLNVLCHRNGIVPPNVRTRDPLPARQVVVSSACISGAIRRSLAAAAGFGGAVAAVSLTGGPTS